MWAVLRERLPLLCAVVAAALVFALLMYGCGSVEGPCDMDECNLECLESDRGDYALGSCVEDRCRCVPAWRGDAGPDGGDGDVDTDVDSDVDSDSDSDTDTGPECGPDTWDLNCDGLLDPECVGPKELGGGEETTYLELTPVIGTGETCEDLGITRFSGVALGYPGANWGSFCDGTATLLLPRGCYAYRFIGLSAYGTPRTVGLEFLRFPEETAEDLVVWPCDERNCPD